MEIKIILIFTLLLLFSLFLTSECRAERSKIVGGGRRSSSGLLGFGGKDGEFKILQVADMHYADGRDTKCEDVLPAQMPDCSDLNTTAFIYRVIQAEKPDLIVFTGDNIYGLDSTDAAKSMNMAFAPAITLKLPWAAVLGNHDQEGTLSREGVMQHIVGMAHTLSKLNPSGMDIDGFGNYNLEVAGAEGSSLANKSVLNLYFLDSGDYSTIPSLIPGYGWIKPSQQVWFQQTSSHLQKVYKSEPQPQNDPAPALAYFHIPLPEFSSFDASNFTGVKQEGISSPSINSGFFTTMVEAGDVKAAFIGHDHVNDFCGKLTGIHLCYAGGFGYHAYGKAGWSRRARVISASLEKTINGEWGGVKTIKTWKRLDDEYLSTIDSQVLWSKGFGGNVANEIADLINQNRSAGKLPKLLDSKGLGCMALQYISECIGNCGSNNTLKCQPPEVDITEVYAPNCGVELPTVETISGQIVGCQWKYLNPEEAFSQILVSDKKSLTLLHSKEHTEVGVGVRRVKKGASFWCILFSSGRTDTSFVLEGGGRGIEQKNGCFSGTGQPCSAGRQVKFLDDTMVFAVVILFYAFVLLGV